MSIKDDLTNIRKDLIPWIRQYDLLDDNDKPGEPPKQALERLILFVEEHPDNEPGLRELLTVQLLMGNRVAGVLLLKRIIELPGNKSPKVLAKDKAQLKNLMKNPNEELDELLCNLELSRECFLELGRYVEIQSDKNQEIYLRRFLLAKSWATEIRKMSAEDWEKLQVRFFNAGIFSDYDIREAYFEMTP